MARHATAHLVVLVLSVDVWINVPRIVGRDRRGCDLWSTKTM
jgi:hypothetical protein